MESTVLSFVLIFFALVNFSSAMDKQEAMALCMQKHSITEEMFNHFMQKGEVPDESSTDQKCVFHCIANKLGMVDDNGNMDIPKIKEKMILKYEKMSPESVVAVVEKCAVRSETDTCDKVYQFHKCFKKMMLAS